MKDAKIPLIGLLVIGLIVGVGLVFAAVRSDNNATQVKIAKQNATAARYKACDTLPVAKRQACINPHPKVIIKTKVVSQPKVVNPPNVPSTYDQAIARCEVLAQSDGTSSAQNYGICVQDITNAWNAQNDPWKN